MKIPHLTHHLLTLLFLSFSLGATAFFASVPSPRLRVTYLHASPSKKSVSNSDSRKSSAVDVNRRDAIASSLTLGAMSLTMLIAQMPTPAIAYTPDSDPLRESLYLVCRVQEATCLQERYIEKSRPPIQKMKLSLRLVDKSYRLLDQVNFISKAIPDNNIVVATQLGNEAADALQEAIDFVNELGANKQQLQQDGRTSMTKEQREFLKTTLAEIREKLFNFLEYLPPAEQAKLEAARSRVEQENKLNKDEFDPDLASDAGVYNPVVLPWKDRPKKA